MEASPSAISVSPLRIVHLIDSGGFFGAEQMILTLAKEQQQSGHTATVANIVAPEDDGNPLGEAASSAGLPVEEFLMADGFSFRSLNKIRKWLEQSQTTILHCHGSKANILMSLIPRWQRTWALVTTLHGWTDRGGTFRARLTQSLERSLLPLFDIACIVSSTLRERIPSVVLRWAKVKEIPNGIETSSRCAVLPEDISNFASGRKIILAVGRLSTEKNFPLLLDAMNVVLEKNRKCCLIIVGDGAQRAGLYEKATFLGISDSVFFAGYRSNPRSWMHDCDAYVLSSSTEGLPLVLLEALLAGLPVVSTDVGSVSEVVQGTDGRVVPSADPNAIAQALLATLSEGNDDTRREARRNRVLTRYSAPAMAASYERAYREAWSTRFRHRTA